MNTHTLSPVGLERNYLSREMTFGLIRAQGARWSASWLLPCIRRVPHSCDAAVNKLLESEPQYFPALDVFVLVNDWNIPAYVFRLR